MTQVWMTAALRTPVSPRDGAFKNIEVADLAAPLLRQLAQQIDFSEIRAEVILGNALYGGGNPARVAALAAGLPEHVPALTLDTQCCSGLDAIAFGCARIRSGDADMVLAGGLESFSRAPLRFRKPQSPDAAPIYYARPPFTPWADRDPDLIAANAQLAHQLGISRKAQEAFAIESHRKALAHVDGRGEIFAIGDVARDGFARKLTDGLCARLPVLSGTDLEALTGATIAVEADAAAIVVLVSEKFLPVFPAGNAPLCVTGSIVRGYDPAQPALAPVEAARALLARAHIAAPDLATIEIMEAFAVQAMAFVNAMDIDPAKVNRGGGALSRGHPIGASGAIQVVRLFHEMQYENAGSSGLAAIAAAGGLGSALLLTAG